MENDNIDYKELYKQIRDEYEQFKLEVWKKQQHRLPEVDIEAITEWLTENAIAVVAGTTIVSSAVNFGIVWLLRRFADSNSG